MICSLKKYSWSHINKVLSGVSFFLKLYNLPSLFSFIMVRQALKGYKKRNRVEDSREPISTEVLERLCAATEKICWSHFESTLFKAVFSVAFFASLRILELLPPAKHKQGGLKWEDLLIEDKLVRICIRRLKTDQTGKGSWIVLNACNIPSLCPVTALNAYIRQRPAVQGEFFIHSDGSPLTKYQFMSVFDKCKKVLGLEHTRLTSHSFRIGAATEAVRLGLEEKMVKKIGKWKSDSFLLYVHPNFLI